MRTLATFATSLFRCVLALFRGREEQAIVELALRQQLAVYAQNRPRPGFHRWIEPSGSCSPDTGRAGRILLSSFVPKPWCAGIAKDFAGTGEEFGFVEKSTKNVRVVS
jgi:hypothetical protein